MTDIHGGKGILRQDSGKFFYLYVNKSNQMDLLVAESETGPWKSLGSPGVPNVSYDLAVSEGIPYVFYKDVERDGKATVKYFDDHANEWVPIGEPGFSPNEVNTAKIAVDESGVYVAFLNLDPLPANRKTKLWKFDGGEWQELLEIGANREVDLKLYNHEPYIAAINGSTVTAVTYGASGMEIIGSAPVASGLNTVNQTVIWVNEDDVYVGYVNVNGSSIHTWVMKHEKGVPGWSQVGDPIPNASRNINIFGLNEGMILTYTSYEALLKTLRFNGTNWEEMLAPQCLDESANYFSVTEMNGKLYAVTSANASTKGFFRVLDKAVPVSITLDWKNATDGSGNLLDTEPVTITATLTPASGTAQPEGKVKFRDANTLLPNGEVTVVDGKAEWTGMLEAVQHNVTVQYCAQGLFVSGFSDPATDIDVQVTPMAGSGTEDDPYIILTPGQLRAAAATTGKFYRLGRDLDFANFWDDDADSSNGSGWMPVDFNGTIDGAGYKIKNLKITRPTLEGAGLFRTLTGKAVNLQLVQPVMSGKSVVGSIAGYLNNGIIERSSSTAMQIAAQGTDVGGLAGRATGYSVQTRIENSYAAGVIMGQDNLGGLIGQVTGVGNPAIRYSYAAVSYYLIGGTNKGGIVV